MKNNKKIKRGLTPLKAIRHGRVPRSGLLTGFTLVEAMVVVGVISIITLAVLEAVVSWQRSWNIGEVQMDVQFEARRAMVRMAKELVQSSSSVVSINPAMNAIIFQLPNNDYAAGAFTWGDRIQYSLGAAGSVTQLLRTNLNNNQVEVLASYINAVQFGLSGDVVSIQLTVSKTLKGDSSQMQLNSQVSLRNL